MRHPRFFLRLLFTIMISLTMLVPGAVAAFFLARHIKSNESLLISLLFIIFIIANLAWFIFRIPKLIKMVATTSRSNAAFKLQLKNVNVVIAQGPTQLYFRKSWTWFVSPIAFSILVLTLSEMKINDHTYFGVLILGLILDYFIFASSPLIWYVQKNNTLICCFLMVPIFRVKLSEAKCFYWVARGYRAFFNRIKVLDEELKNILTLPVEAYNFQRLRQELLAKCIEVPVTLHL